MLVMMTFILFMHVVLFLRVDELAVLEVGKFADALLFGQGRDLHVDVATGHLRLLIGVSHLHEVLTNAFGQLETDFLVSHLTALELQLQAHLVAIGEEFLGMENLDEIIVRIDPDPEFELLELATFLSLGSLFLLLLLFVLELAVIDNLTNGRIRAGGDFDEVQSAIFRGTDGLPRGHDAHLLAGLSVNHAHFWCPDTVVDTGLICKAASAIEAWSWSVEARVYRTPPVG